MDNFDLWTDEDLQKACKFGFTVAGGLIGGAFGGFASAGTVGAAAPLTVPAGAAYGAAFGLAAGLLACPYVSKEKSERFLFGQTMHKSEAASVLSALAKISGARSKEQVLLLAAALRHVYAAQPIAAGPAKPGTPSALANAQLLLARLRPTENAVAAA